VSLTRRVTLTSVTPLDSSGIIAALAAEHQSPWAACCSTDVKCQTMS